MGSYKKLARNSFLFFLANFGSKILTFIIVPYYTYVLTTKEYGTVDIVVSTVALVSPVVTFGMNDIITLFLVREEYSEKKIFTNSFFVLLVGNVIVCILFPLISSIESMKDYTIFFFLLVLSQSLYGSLQSYARGVGKVVSFAVSGILYTAILVILNLVFLTVFDMGVQGYLLSMVLAYTICDLYLLARIGVIELFCFVEMDTKYIKKMLKLSIPLLPTAILWWLMNICDKYTILFYMSASANGLYTVAHKLPTILATIYSVFQQAWQLTSLQMKTQKERTEMYSNLFEVLSCILIVATSALIMLSKFYVVVFCESTYEKAWLVTPILLISAIFNSFSGFFESNYFLMRNTTTILKITVIGTVINCVLNIILVPILGLQGAGLATCSGFVYMTLHKMIGTRKFTPLRVNLKRFIFALILIICQSVITINIENNYIYFIGIVAIVILIIIYKDIVSVVLDKGLATLRSKILRR